MMDSPYCLFCQSDRVVANNRLPILFNNKVFNWLDCKNCKLLFLFPALTEDDKKLLYAPSYHQQYYFNYTENYAPQLKTIRKYGKKTVLDYGCGDAGLISFLHRNKYEVTGVEYDEFLIEKLRQNFIGINFITEKDFWSKTETYDIIHLGDVLEHTSDPINLMGKLTAKLNPGGLFFIEGPLECNPSIAYYFRLLTYAIKSRVNKESVRVKLPYHITFSTAKNQRLFFEKLKIEEKEYTVLEAGWPYLDKLEEVRSPWLFLQFLIARFSILVSTFTKGWGNRFVYVGKPLIYIDKIDKEI